MEVVGLPREGVDFVHSAGSSRRSDVALRDSSCSWCLRCNSCRRLAGGQSRSPKYGRGRALEAFALVSDRQTGPGWRDAINPCVAESLRKRREELLLPASRLKPRA